MSAALPTVDDPHRLKKLTAFFFIPPSITVFENLSRLFMKSENEGEVVAEWSVVDDRIRYNRT